MAVAGRRLGLSDKSAVLFGNQVAHLLSGGAISARDAFMRGLASQAIAAPFEADGSRANLLSVAPWRDAQPELARLYDQFASWTRSRKRWPGRGSIGTGSTLRGARRYDANLTEAPIEPRNQEELARCPLPHHWRT